MSSGTAAISLYIYYRVREPAQAAPRIRAMQTALMADTGVQGQLMRRSDDATTLMEVYENLDDAAAFESALDAAVAKHGITALLASGTTRHVERFTCV